MLSELISLPVLSGFNNNVGSSNTMTASKGANPFSKFGDILGSYQAPIGDFGIIVAVISAVVLLCLMMFAGEQMRSKIKKHLLVIIGCVICLLGVSYFVEFTAKQGQSTFDTIVPNVTSYLRTIFPSL